MILGKFKSEYFVALKNLFPEVTFESSKFQQCMLSFLFFIFLLLYSFFFISCLVLLVKVTKIAFSYVEQDREPEEVL